MRPRDASYLLDIVNAAKSAQGFVVGMTQEEFNTDEKTQAAVERKLEIIGEATKRLSDEFRAEHREVPWQRIAGMRDVIIHDYDDVDLKQVWSVATVFLAELVEVIEPLIS